MHKQSQRQKRTKIRICCFKELGCLREALNSGPPVDGSEMQATLPLHSPGKPEAAPAFPCSLICCVSCLLGRALPLLTIPEGEWCSSPPRYTPPPTNPAIRLLLAPSYTLPPLAGIWSRDSHRTYLWLKSPWIERWEHMLHTHSPKGNPELKQVEARSSLGEIILHVNRSLYCPKIYQVIVCRQEMCCDGGKDGPRKERHFKSLRHQTEKNLWGPRIPTCILSFNPHCLNKSTAVKIGDFRHTAEHPCPIPTSEHCSLWLERDSQDF